MGVSGFIVDGKPLTAFQMEILNEKGRKDTPGSREISRMYLQ